jgi:hypothetical protein
MATYEAAYSSKTTSANELSYSDIVLVEAETHEQLSEKVADLIRKLGPPGSYYVDSIGVTLMHRVLKGTSQRR